MEKRSAERHIVDFKTELSYGGKYYAGVVENISENGLYMTAYPLNTGIHFTSGEALELKFQLSSREVIKLPCEVKWSYKTYPHGSAFSIGTEIVESPLEYKEFIKSLSLKTRKPRVIIFDDEDLFENSLKKWLCQKGYETFTFRDSTACPIFETRTDSCMNENPCADMIITDFTMPEMNGIELLHYQSQKGCKIDNRNKAIVLGYMDDHLVKFMNESDYTFFEKPLNLSVISDWLSGCRKRIDLSLPLDSL
jgi:CheY-like chemotaxis protein